MAVPDGAHPVGGRRVGRRDAQRDETGGPPLLLSLASSPSSPTGGVVIIVVCSGIVFTNEPSLNCGERRIRAARSGPDSSGRTPSSAGTSRSAHPAAARAAPPTRIRRAVRIPVIATLPWIFVCSAPTGRNSPVFLRYIAIRQTVLIVPPSMT
ncbi:hypothetical protein ACFQQB_52930 [Nonomuraea rubra]|uniref:hypothetical protein n=1 Tax=Nonomuraea rubra TaxID=46180 RepID=UPI003617A2FA